MTVLRPAPTGYAIKLVRDNTPDIINSTGEPGDLFYDTLDLDNAEDRRRYYRALLDKIHEETGELLLDQSANELVDLYIAVMALADFYSIDLENRAKSDARGGFSKGVIMYGRHPEFDVERNDEIRGRA